MWVVNELNKLIFVKRFDYSDVGFGNTHGLGASVTVIMIFKNLKKIFKGNMHN